MALRGTSTAREAKQKAQSRKGSGRFARRFQSEVDEEVLFRVRGLSRAPALQYTDKELRDLDEEEFFAHMDALQCTYREDMDDDALVGAVLTRYGQIEPAINARHYCDRNKGKKNAFTFQNCGDSETAVMGDIRQGTSCKSCQARLDGDKGMGWPQTTYYWTVYDYRASHQIIRGEDKEYKPCTREEDEEDGDTSCKFCNKNFKLDERPQEEIMAVKNKDGESEEMKELQARGYARRFVHGNRMLHLAQKFADLLLAMDVRLRKRCKACGTGKLKKVGAYCPNPNCEEEYDFKELKAAGWNPDDPQPIECPHCEEEVMPELLYECSECEEPEPASLCDVDILGVMTGEGTSKNWSFTEQFPIRPLSLHNEEDLPILADPLPDYERELAPPSEEEQDRFIGGGGKAAPVRSGKGGGEFSKRKGGFMGGKKKSRDEDDDEDEGEEEERPRRRKKAKGGLFKTKV